METIQTSIRLPKPVWLWLRGKAGSEGKSANEYLRELAERTMREEATTPGAAGILRDGE